MPELITQRVIYDAIEALNYSGAKELLKSPAHFKVYREREREETKALRVGSAVHKLTLEGRESYSSGYAVAPEVDKRTKDGKEAWAAFCTMNQDKTILTKDESDLVEAVAASAAECMKTNGIILSKTEVMFTTFLGDTLVKCAIDGISDDGYIYDLKTCEDASPAGFLKSVRAYRYNLQAYFYRQAVESAFKCRTLGFRFIAVEKEPPYAHAVYEIGPELMNLACMDFEKALKTYKTCKELDSWPGYADGVNTIDIPSKSVPSAPIAFA